MNKLFSTVLLFSALFGAACGPDLCMGVATDKVCINTLVTLGSVGANAKIDQIHVYGLGGLRVDNMNQALRPVIAGQPLTFPLHFAITPQSVTNTQYGVSVSGFLAGQPVARGRQAGSLSTTRVDIAIELNRFDGCRFSGSACRPDETCNQAIDDCVPQ